MSEEQREEREERSEEPASGITATTTPEVTLRLRKIRVDGTIEDLGEVEAEAIYMIDEKRRVKGEVR